MAFTIHYGGTWKAFDDSHEMDLKDSGVIEVTKEGKRVVLYSPGYWTYVEPKLRKRSAPSRVR